MSDLQLGLAIAGGVLLAGFVAHSTWTTRRNTPRQATPSDPATDHMGGPREPVLDDVDLSAAVAAIPAASRRPAMDALIDVIATVALDPATPAVSGEAALAAMPATRRAGTKPFAIEGYNLATGVWEPPLAGQRYGGFQAGVQLANRSGALNEIEYSEFVVKTQAFADALGATPDFPEMLDEVARARELDQFASAHDAQLGFSIRARQAAWSPGYIQQHAAKLGFVAGVIPGRLALPASGDGMPAVLALGFDAQAAMAEDPEQSAVRTIALHLDVAQVERGENAFERLRDAALALAHSMDGIVTDDDGQPISAQAMGVIGAELEQLYNTLEQRDLAAGSALARRLFS